METMKDLFQAADWKKEKHVPVIEKVPNGVKVIDAKRGSPSWTRDSNPPTSSKAKPSLCWSKYVVGAAEADACADRAEWVVADEPRTVCCAARAKSAAKPSRDPTVIRLLRSSRRACCRRRTSV